MLLIIKSVMEAALRTARKDLDAMEAALRKIGERGGIRPLRQMQTTHSYSTIATNAWQPLLCLIAHKCIVGICLYGQRPSKITTCSNLS